MSRLSLHLASAGVTLAGFQPYELTHETIAAVVQTFGAPVPLHYGAEDFAVGWVVAVEQRGDELWGTVQLHDDVSWGGYRTAYSHVSPAILACRQLLSVKLTNNGTALAGRTSTAFFLDGSQPAREQRAPTSVQKEDERFKALHEVLRISDREHVAWHAARSGIEAIWSELMSLRQRDAELQEWRVLVGPGGPVAEDWALLKKTYVVGAKGCDEHCTVKNCCVKRIEAALGLDK